MRTQCGELKKKALFLDRDGVVNVDTGYTHKIEDCQFVEGIFELCALAHAKGYMLIIVTNQAGIARGYYGIEDYENFMRHVRDEFLAHGCPLDDDFFCPYHPDGQGEFRKISMDRKPEPGMILKAIAKYGIDAGSSILLGDKESDMQAGLNAGIKNCVLVRDRIDVDSISKLLI